jgi:hypothetical protein
VQRLEGAEWQLEELGRQAEEIHHLRADLARRRMEDRATNRVAPAALGDPSQGGAPLPSDLPREVERLMPADLRPAAAWSDEGAATPEAACHTLDWSVRVGLTSLPRTGWNAQPDCAEWAPFSRVVARRGIGPEEVEFTVEYRQVRAEVSFVQRHFRRDGGEWRLVVPDAVLGSD